LFPVTVTVADPVEAPLQSTLVTALVDAIELELFTVAVAVAVQPFPSVTVTTYEPAARLVTVAVL
jgi:hypothetical protein